MLKQNNSRGAPYMARPHKQTLVNRRNPINESLLTIHHQRTGYLLSSRFPGVDVLMLFGRETVEVNPHCHKFEAGNFSVNLFGN